MRNSYSWVSAERNERVGKWCETVDDRYGGAGDVYDWNEEQT